MADAVDMAMYAGHPTAEQAYQAAPDIEHEDQALAELAATLDAPGRPAYLVQAGPSERREVLLRQAAVADRRAIAAPSSEAAQRVAAYAGFVLLRFDLHHPDEAAPGGEGPNSPLWDGEGGTRAYTRSQYRQWLTVPPGCADPCPDDAPCAWHAR